MRIVECGRPIDRGGNLSPRTIIFFQKATRVFVNVFVPAILKDVSIYLLHHVFDFLVLLARKSFLGIVQKMPLATSPDINWTSF